MTQRRTEILPTDTLAAQRTTLKTKTNEFIMCANHSGPCILREMRDGLKDLVLQQSPNEETMSTSE